MIHQLWIGSELPEGLKSCTRVWQEMHPKWEYRLWTEEELADLETPYDDVIANAADYVPADAVYQFKSDLYRWVILREYGGLWADTDTWPLKPVDGLITDSAVFGWEIQNQWVGTSTFYIERGHPVLDAIHACVVDLIERSPRPTRPNQLTGPKAITRPVVKSGVLILDEPVWYPVRWDRPLDAEKEHGDETFVVHGWNHQREINGLPSIGVM